MRQSNAHDADTWAIDRRIMFQFSKLWVHDSKPYYVFNVHNGSLSDADRGLPPSASCALYALHWRIERALDSL